MESFFFLAPLHGCEIRPDFESQLQRYHEYELALHEKEHPKSPSVTRGPCPTQLAARPDRGGGGAKVGKIAITIKLCITQFFLQIFFY